MHHVCWLIGIGREQMASSGLGGGGASSPASETASSGGGSLAFFLQLQLLFDQVLNSAPAHLLLLILITHIITSKVSLQKVGCHGVGRSLLLLLLYEVRFIG